MTKEQEIEQEAVSEPLVDTGSDALAVEQQERQVPLSALEAERQKRQERDQENLYLRELAQRQKSQLDSLAKAAPDEDDEEFVNRRDLKQFKEHLSREDLAAMKREIAEESYKEANPESIKQINMHLEQIIEKRPWLADSIKAAPNRYSRAYQIVQDYAPMVQKRSSQADDAKRIVENSKKPGSPVTAGKAANMSQADNMLSYRGKKDWAAERARLRRG
jgi:hypothetical protein